MKFISGMIIGEINGIALGIAGSVVALCVAAICDKKDYQKKKDAYRYTTYRDYLNRIRKGDTQRNVSDTEDDD